MLTQKEINQYINCVKKNYNGPYKIKRACEKISVN